MPHDSYRFHAECLLIHGPPHLLRIVCLSRLTCTSLFLVITRVTCMPLEAAVHESGLLAWSREDALPSYGNFLLHRCHLMIMNIFIDAAAPLLLVTIVLDMISTSCY